MALLHPRTGTRSQIAATNTGVSTRSQLQPVQRAVQVVFLCSTNTAMDMGATSADNICALLLKTSRCTTAQHSTRAPPEQHYSTTNLLQLNLTETAHTPELHGYSELHDLQQLNQPLWLTAQHMILTNCQLSTPAMQGMPMYATCQLLACQRWASLTRVSAGTSSQSMTLRWVSCSCVWFPFSS
jgi:hypothetical protein